ncbi:MAG: cardiolipin synthase [Gammaproteobacteria bacterium]
MNLSSYEALVGVILLITLQAGFIARVLLRPNRQPAARLAWIVVITALPVIGVLSYLFFGEVDLGRQRVARLRRVIAAMPPLPVAVSGDEANLQAPIPERHQSLFRVGRSVNGFAPLGGNTAQLMADSNAAVDALVRDIDSARDHVHVLFYIWLPDSNGCKLVNALQRAARRGVTCRALADDLGSRLMIKSKHWQAMLEAGVKLAAALPIGNPLLKPFKGRIDLRNHRKIVVIDGQITYCGSQNMTDPEFLIKARFGPWVDAMIRLTGPIATQNQRLFASDWETETGENLDELLCGPLAAPQPGIAAQVIGTGPTERYSAMPEVFGALLHAARDELVITTPYYVPDESMQNALCAAAYRGVSTTLIVPARNDSWIVSAASRSYYDDLLSAGVKLYEYEGGLLHTKSITLDGEITLIGSANMDRRSFDLNFENNILFYDPTLTAQVRERQNIYLTQSRIVRHEAVTAWPMGRRLWNNAVAIVGPLL